MACNFDILETVKNYILENHFNDVETILFSQDVTLHYSITIFAMNLFESSVKIIEALLETPNSVLKALDQALFNACRCLHEDHISKESMCIKPNVHTRLIAFPLCNEIKRSTLPKAGDVGKFLIITGTVIRTTTVKLLEYRKEFICNRCNYLFPLEADVQQYFIIARPITCPNPEGCGSNKFRSLGEDMNPTWCRDFQEVKIQEQVHHLIVGKMPRSMWLVLENDLVDLCKPGNDVQISGIVVQRWKPLYPNSKSDIELILHAHNVEVKNDRSASTSISDELMKDFENFWVQHEQNPLTGRNLILSSLCPQVYGLYIVKLAVALILVGGVQRIDPSGTRVRGESHLLLVGDPGTGKSQFLKYAVKMCPRSVLTTGIGTTSAGLTVTAIRDGNEWQLEAGALVLADGGVCCIDEFNSIKEQDRASIHEAMEQQTISVAKAGMVCRLSSKCCIIAATNPKGNYDPSQPLAANISVASPLLSRFDLVFVLQDQRNEDWDLMVSSYILAGQDPVNLQEPSKLWSLDKMQSYFAVVKSKQPTLTEDCNNILQCYYQFQRGTDDRNVARTTIRLLESMVRLAQAHACLMFRSTVTVVDAIVAINLMESSFQGASLSNGLNTLHTAFPEDPELEYKCQAQHILGQLKLDDILEREEARLSKQSVGRNSNTVLDASIELNNGIINNEGPRNSTQKLDMFIEPLTNNSTSQIIVKDLSVPPKEKESLSKNTEDPWMKQIQSDKKTSRNFVQLAHSNNLDIDKETISVDVHVEESQQEETVVDASAKTVLKKFEKQLNPCTRETLINTDTNEYFNQEKQSPCGFRENQNESESNDRTNCEQGIVNSEGNPFKVPSARNLVNMEKNANADEQKFWKKNNGTDLVNIIQSFAYKGNKTCKCLNIETVTDNTKENVMSNSKREKWLHDDFMASLQNDFKELENDLDLTPIITITKKSKGKPSPIKYVETPKKVPVNEINMSTESRFESRIINTPTELSQNQNQNSKPGISKISPSTIFKLNQFSYSDNQSESKTRLVAPTNAKLFKDLVTLEPINDDWDALEIASSKTKHMKK